MRDSTSFNCIWKSKYKQARSIRLEVQNIDTCNTASSNNSKWIGCAVKLACRRSKTSLKHCIMVASIIVIFNVAEELEVLLSEFWYHSAGTRTRHLGRRKERRGKCSSVQKKPHPETVRSFCRTFSKNCKLFHYVLVLNAFSWKKEDKIHQHGGPWHNHILKP